MVIFNHGILQNASMIHGRLVESLMIKVWRDMGLVGGVLSLVILIRDQTLV